MTEKSGRNCNQNSAMQKEKRWSLVFLPTFLAESEAAGMTLEECPRYVRKWIDQQNVIQ